MSLLILNEDELRQVVTIGDAITSVEAAFIASVEGRIQMPGDFTLNLPEVKGEVQVKGTYLTEAPYYVIKISNNFQENPLINLPVGSGVTAVFDAATGFPAAILMDNGYVASIRAAAAGALAAEYLANRHLGHVAVIGAGDQAYMQLKSLMQVRQIGTVSVWAASPMQADSYARKMIEDHDLDITIAPSIEHAVKSADLIISATNSQQPLIRAAWLKPGVHLTAVGNRNQPKHELYLDVLQRAEVIITDNQEATTGEIHYALKVGAITRDRVQGTLGQLIAGQTSGRSAPTQITLADLTGLDTQDTVVATLALDKALFLDLGQRVADGATTAPAY